VCQDLPSKRRGPFSLATGIPDFTIEILESHFRQERGRETLTFPRIRRRSKNPSRQRHIVVQTNLEQVVPFLADDNWQIRDLSACVVKNRKTASRREEILLRGVNSGATMAALNVVISFLPFYWRIPLF
jgi:hypothetical protein